MDFIEYNMQAIDCSKCEIDSALLTITYTVPHVDVVNYVYDSIEDPDPWYLEGSPFGGPIVPPGYFYDEYSRLLVCANIQMGVLNAKMSYESKGAILHGEQVTVKGSIRDVYEKKGRPYMDVSVVVINKDGNEVSRGIVTLLLSLEKKEG